MNMKKDEINPNFKSFGWKYLAIECFSLESSHCDRIQYWYGIRIVFFRIWIGRYYA
jgi:hypothetical protein